MEPYTPALMYMVTGIDFVKISWIGIICERFSWMRNKLCSIRSIVSLHRDKPVSDSPQKPIQQKTSEADPGGFVSDWMDAVGRYDLYLARATQHHQRCGSQNRQTGDFGNGSGYDRTCNGDRSY